MASFIIQRNHPALDARLLTHVHTVQRCRQKFFKVADANDVEMSILHIEGKLIANADTAGSLSYNLYVLTY